MQPGASYTSYQPPQPQQSQPQLHTQQQQQQQQQSQPGLPHYPPGAPNVTSGDANAPQAAPQLLAQLPPAIASSIYLQEALALPSKQEVRLKMCNLSLFSSGVFSNVYRGILLEPEPAREIALKKTWPNDDERSTELIILLALSRARHKNIVQVLYTFQTLPDARSKHVCESLIFDFMPQTLTATIPDLFGPPMNVNDIKLYSWQIFNGLYFLMRRRICHRDIKPQNILVNTENGNIKIGDFGSAKCMINVVSSTSYQVTRFYRPPELLLDSTQYSCAVDVWSAGCCVGEMLRGSVLLPGRDTKHQLKLIMQCIGSPSEADLVSMKTSTKIYCEKVSPKGFGPLIPTAPTSCVSFLERILVFNPRIRLKGRELLLDSFFSDLFVPGKRRNNGQLISEVVTPEDITELAGRHSKRHSNGQH